jgi:hypothetical protein
MIKYFAGNEHDTTFVNVSDYESKLNIKCWGNPYVKKLRYTPLTVLSNPAKYNRDFKRIVEANMEHPIIIYNNQVIDGMHRLTKAYSHGQVIIGAYKISSELFSKFCITSDITKEWWTYVRSLDETYFERLYKIRFIH